jgi:hypothetical protein
VHERVLCGSSTSDSSRGKAIADIKDHLAERKGNQADVFGNPVRKSEKRPPHAGFFDFSPSNGGAENRSFDASRRHPHARRVSKPAGRPCRPPVLSTWSTDQTDPTFASLVAAISHTATATRLELPEHHIGSHCSRRCRRPLGAPTTLPLVTLEAKRFARKPSRPRLWLSSAVQHRFINHVRSENAWSERPFCTESANSRRTFGPVASATVGSAKSGTFDRRTCGEHHDHHSRLSGLFRFRSTSRQYLLRRVLAVRRDRVQQATAKERFAKRVDLMSPARSTPRLQIEHTFRTNGGLSWRASRPLPGRHIPRDGIGCRV